MRLKERFKKADQFMLAASKKCRELENRYWLVGKFGKAASIVAPIGIVAFTAYKSIETQHPGWIAACLLACVYNALVATGKASLQRNTSNHDDNDPKPD